MTINKFRFRSLEKLKTGWDKSGTKQIMSLGGMGIYLVYRLSRDKIEAELFRLVSGTGRTK